MEILINIMKRLIIVSLIVFVLLSSVVLAQSGFGALTEGESKVFDFGPYSYSIEVTAFDGKSIIFRLGETISKSLVKGESFTFENGVTVSVDEFVLSSSSTVKPIVRFYVDVKTESCGTARCFPGERCANIEYCYNPDNCVSKKGCEVYCGNGICNKGEKSICAEDCEFCGNGKCETSELCSTCEADCGCDMGLTCETDSCVEAPVLEEPVKVEDVVSEQAEMNIFQKFFGWLRSLFVK